MVCCYARTAKSWQAARHDQFGALLAVTGSNAANLTEDAWYVFSLCDGRHNFASPAFLPRHREALKWLLHQGAVWRCPQGFSGDEPLIKGALWAVTGKCNMQCRHCYMGAPEGQSELPFSALTHIVDALCDGGATDVQLTGGEPFMRRDLFDLLALLGERGITTTDIFTNATLMNDKILTQIADTSLRLRFHVSFDGVGVHDQMRGVTGAEVRTMRGIRMLNEAGHTVIVTTSVDQSTLPALDATYDAMRALGVYAWGIGRPVAAGCAKNMIRVEDAAFALACENLLQRWQRDGKPFTLGLEAFFSEIVGSDERVNNPPFHPGLFACESCRVYPHITHTGALIPCACYADTEYGNQFGNLAQMSWEEAWNNPVLRRVMDITKADVLKNNPQCKTCEHLDGCRTGCRVNALLAGNGLTGLDETVCNLFQSGLKERFSALGGQRT